MLKSTEHILTTHTGSLPRGAELNDLLIADEAGEKVDQAKLTDSYPLGQTGMLFAPASCSRFRLKAARW